MNIYIVRHGQTNLNSERKVQGRNGEPLNETGILQAKDLQNKFETENIKFDFVFSSPQERAIQTAEISSKMKPIIDNRLDVYDLGTADRLPITEVKLTGVVPDMSIYDGVENVEDYKERIYSFINEIIEKYKNEDVNILIVGHKCTTGIISAYFENFKVETIYDNFLQLACKNGEYKKYTL